MARAVFARLTVIPPQRCLAFTPQRFERCCALTALILLRGALASDCDTDEYYADVDLTLTGSALRAALHARIKSPHTVIPYTSSATDVWDALKVIDADPATRIRCSASIRDGPCQTR